MTLPHYSMLINGKKEKGKGSFPIDNPATGEAIAHVPEVSPENIQDCLNSAQAAFKKWSAMSLAERREPILNYAALLEKNSTEIIDLLISETGKPLDNAQYDFGMLVDCLRFFLEEAARLDQPIIRDANGKFLNYMLRQPLGVVVGYLAWNFPLLNLGYKLGPVLAAGCTAIIKPSQLTPLASLKCAELSLEAGIPAGVINMITGNDYSITEPLLTSHKTAMFTMIGSTKAGVGAMHTASTNIKHYSVELGGNAPVIVYDDADIKKAAADIVGLKFANAGQVCVSPNRCFVHERIYEEFLAEAKKQAANFVLGSGHDKGQLMGPMISDKDRKRVLEMVKKAQEKGAKLICGGKAAERKGYFMEPTILCDVDRKMPLSCDEIFGPVLPVLPFSDKDDEIALANDTDLGLAAYAYTENLTRALKAAEKIQAGSVCINRVHYDLTLPHGGLKQSGIGKDCSHYSLEEYLTLKRISIFMGDE